VVKSEGLRKYRSKQKGDPMISDKNPYFLLVQRKQGASWEVMAAITSATELVDAFGLELLPQFARMAVPAEEIDCTLQEIPYKQISRLAKVAVCPPGKTWPQWLTGRVALNVVSDGWANARRKITGKVAKDGSI
jgi:hypothetical protein